MTQKLRVAILAAGLTIACGLSAATAADVGTPEARELASLPTTIEAQAVVAGDTGTEVATGYATEDAAPMLGSERIVVPHAQPPKQRRVVVDRAPVRPLIIHGITY